MGDLECRPDTASIHFTHSGGQHLPNPSSTFPLHWFTSERGGRRKVAKGFWVGGQTNSLTLLSFRHHTTNFVYLFVLLPVSNISIGGVGKSRGAVLALRCDDG